jgi:hypothetical protein
MAADLPPLRLPNQRLPDYPQSLQPGEAETLYNDGAMAKTVDGAVRVFRRQQRSKDPQALPAKLVA